MFKRIFGYYLPTAFIFIKKVVLHIFWVIIGKIRVKNLVLRTQQGVFKISTNDSAIGYTLFMQGKFEYDFSLLAIDFLRTRGFVQPDNLVFLDVGANIGIISIGLMRQGKIAHAIAVEPEAKNFELLVENVRRNDFTERILCMPFALGKQKTVLNMELSPTNFGDHRIQGANTLTHADLYSEDRRNLVKVTSIPLDDLIELPEVVNKKLPLANSVLWIDVQGYEGFVFQGSRKFLANGVPAVSEIWPYGILRAGMSLNEFTGIVASIWSDYWVLRGERFIRYPIAMFDRYLDEVGEDNGTGNVIFSKC